MFQLKCSVSFGLAVLLLTFAVGESGAFAQNTSKAVSGDYEFLLLGVNSQNELTGYFANAVGDDGKGRPQFTCMFFLTGIAQENGRYKLKTWYPEFPDEVISGELTAIETNGKKSVNIRLKELPGGCWNVQPELNKSDGLNLDLEKAGDWQAVRVVSSAKSYFYRATNANTRQKAFLVKNDCVAVRHVKNNRLEIEFFGDNGKSTRGWMPIANFYALNPKSK